MAPHIGERFSIERRVIITPASINLLLTERKERGRLRRLVSPQGGASLFPNPPTAREVPFQDVLRRLGSLLGDVYGTRRERLGLAMTHSWQTNRFAESLS